MFACVFVFMCISRVPDQNGASLAWSIVEIYHSGWKPSICMCVPVTLKSQALEAENES